MSERSSNRVASSVAAIGAVIAIEASARASVSQAEFAPCGSTEHIASFHGLLTYAYAGGSAASISIQVDNTTALALGGYITAIAINPEPGFGGVSFVSCTNANFGGLSAPVNAAPWGDFAAGASLGSSWTGSGAPQGGIAAGSGALFVFSLAGSAAYLGALTAEDVLDRDGYALAVRFRGGAGNDWSDKVLGCALPAPGAASLLGVAGMLQARRRR